MFKWLMMASLLLTASPAAAASWFPESRETSNTQWEDIDASLHQLLGKGFRLLSVTSAFANDPKSTEPTASTEYYLQLGAELVRCYETHSGGNVFNSADATVNAARAGKPLPALVAPSGSYRCFKLVEPHTEPLPK